MPTYTVQIKVFVFEGYEPNIHWLGWNNAFYDKDPNLKEKYLQLKKELVDEILCQKKSELLDDLDVLEVVEDE